MTRTGSRTNPRDRIGTRKDRGLLTCMGEMHRQKKNPEEFRKEGGGVGVYILSISRNQKKRRPRVAQLIGASSGYTRVAGSFLVRAHTRS